MSEGESKSDPEEASYGKFRKFMDRYNSEKSKEETERKTKEDAERKAKEKAQQEEDESLGFLGIGR